MHVRPREPTRSTTAAAAARHNRIVVTGFGPFRGVNDNPSQRLVEALQEQEQQQKEEQGGLSPAIVCCRVIEVRRSASRSVNRTSRAQSLHDGDGNSSITTQVSAVGAEEAVEALHCQVAADDGGGACVVDDDWLVDWNENRNE